MITKFNDYISEQQFIRIERDPDNLTVANGEAGRGIYFSCSNNMVNYYQKMTPEYRTIYAYPKENTLIVDFTKKENMINLIRFIQNELIDISKRFEYYNIPKINSSNYQRYGNQIQDYIKINFPEADAYIVNHEFKGSNLPKGKQLIIIHEDKFIYKEK